MLTTLLLLAQLAPLGAPRVIKDVPISCPPPSREVQLTRAYNGTGGFHHLMQVEGLSPGCVDVYLDSKITPKDSYSFYFGGYETRQVPCGLQVNGAWLGSSPERLVWSFACWNASNEGTRAFPFEASALMFKIFRTVQLQCDVIGKCTRLVDSSAVTWRPDGMNMLPEWVK